MESNLIHDRGRGPELIGTRITVYNLLPYLLDPTATEEYIGQVHDLTSEQVAAARAYVLCNPETVLARHLEIEARIAIGNPPEVIEKAKKTHETFVRFKQWLTERKQIEERERETEVATGDVRDISRQFPTFRQWLADRDPKPGKAS